MTESFQFRSPMPASAEEVYRFHAEPGTPWEKVRVIAWTGSLEQAGSQTTLRVSVGPFSQDWIAEHTACEPGKMFREVMVTGPFRRWEHTHEFQAESAGSSWLTDRVEYEFPLGLLGRLIGGGYTRRRLQRLFRWRHEQTMQILSARKRDERL
jgi:uncharacterized protein